MPQVRELLGESDENVRRLRPPRSRRAAWRRRSAPDRRPAGPVSCSASSIAARAAASSRYRVFSATASTLAGRANQAQLLVQATRCASGGIGNRSSSSTTSEPAWWQSTYACGAEPWISPSVTPEYAGCSTEPCPSTKSSSPPRSTPSTHQLLGRAGDEVGDDRVDRDPPPRDRDPGLPGRHELACDAAPARLAVELERDAHLPDRAVGADGQHDPRSVRQVRAGRDVQARAAACAGRAARRRAPRRARSARRRR